jgi:hypothetical protein
MQSDSTKLPSIVDGLITTYKQRIANIQTTTDPTCAKREKKKTEILNDIVHKVNNYSKEIIESFYKKFSEDKEIDEVIKVCLDIRTTQDREKLAGAFLEIDNQYLGEAKTRIYREFINNSNTPVMTLQDIFEYALGDYTLSDAQERAEFHIDLMKNHNTDLNLLRQIFGKSDSILTENIFTDDYGKKPNKAHEDFYKILINHRRTNQELLKAIFKKVSTININHKDKAEVYITLINHAHTNQELLKDIFNDAKITDIERKDGNKAARDKIIVGEQAIINKATALKDEDRVNVYIALMKNRHTDPELFREILSAVKELKFKSKINFYTKLRPNLHLIKQEFRINVYEELEKFKNKDQKTLITAYGIKEQKQYLIAIEENKLKQVKTDLQDLEREFKTQQQPQPHLQWSKFTDEEKEFMKIMLCAKNILMLNLINETMFTKKRDLKFTDEEKEFIKMLFAENNEKPQDYANVYEENKHDGRDIVQQHQSYAGRLFQEQNEESKNNDRDR